MKAIWVTKTRRTRRHHRGLLSLTLMLGFAPLAIAQTQLPEGNGKRVVQAVCSQCHALRSVTDLRRTANGWEDLVNSMISLGAPLREDEIETVVQYLAKNFGKEAASSDSAKINVNKATAEELQSSLDFSQWEAESVVSYREENGNFSQLEDLKKVPGLDPKKIVDSMISFGKEAASGDSAKIDVNKATAKELQSSLDFSQWEAEAVVSYREENGKFSQLEDLKKVPGLDPKKIEEKKDRMAF